MKNFRVPSDTTSAATVFPELPSDSKALRDAASSREKKRSLIRASRQVERPEHVRATSLSFQNMHQYGELLVNYLKARKRVFIDQLDWQIYEADGMEFDQYDTPQCRWIIVHEFGEILAGIRLSPTTARCGTYSYMLRDAQRGILENMPRDVLFMDAPVDPRVWEAARVFITENVPAQRRMEIQQVLVNQLIATARELGASHVIGIVPAIWSRWLRRLELRAVPIGPRFRTDGTDSQAILFNVVQAMN